MAKRVNGKSKGNSFERTVANLLSSRFADLTGKPQSFRRNPDSGSFFGATNESRIETHNTEYAVYGDIICPRNFKFSLECKHYKDAPSFNSVFSQSVKEWDTWLEQARQDAVNANANMMLIVKYNRCKTIVFLDEKVNHCELAGIYKDTFIYLLDDLLELDDNVFFSDTVV